MRLPWQAQACEIEYVETPVYEGYQFIDCNFIDNFLPKAAENIDFLGRFLQPIEQYFLCYVYYTNTATYSPLFYWFDFRNNGTVVAQFETNAGNWITLNGNYIYIRLLGNIGFNVSGTNGGQTLTFQLQSNQIDYRLSMPGYFHGSGTITEGTNQYPMDMGCLSFAHGYNATVLSMRFECPDQVTAAGIYSNVIEFDQPLFQQTPPVPVAGNAFRQRDYYAHSNTSGNPNSTERGNFGIFRRNGNDFIIDFEYGNDPNFPPPFSVHNTLNAHLINNGTALLVDEFPQGNNICPLAP